MINYRSLASFLFLISLLTRLHAFDIEQGNLVLRIYESTGYFSLYERQTQAGNKLIPLFADQDPRSSFSTILINNREFKLGQTSYFKLFTTQGENSASLYWESPVLHMEQKFSFIQDPLHSSRIFLNMELSFYNVGNGSIDIAYRYLLDTYLGEKTRTHFTTDTRREVAAETLIFPAIDEDRIIYSANESTGLMLSIKNKGRINPDSIHIANWKRLSDYPWKLIFKENRNFNNLPYSVGDSAVTYYFNNRNLMRGQVITFNILMGPAYTSGFPDISTMGPYAGKFLPKVPGSADEKLLRELQELQVTIDYLQRAERDGFVPEEKELLRMEDLLNRISDQAE